MDLVLRNGVRLDDGHEGWTVGEQIAVDEETGAMLLEQGLAMIPPESTADEEA